MTDTSKCYLHIYPHFNCSKFPKKVQEMEMTKKKGYEPWENKSRKSDIGIKDARHKARLVCIAPEHVRYEST